MELDGRWLRVSRKELRPRSVQHLWQERSPCLDLYTDGLQIFWGPLVDPMASFTTSP